MKRRTFFTTSLAGCAAFSAPAQGWTRTPPALGRQLLRDLRPQQLAFLRQWGQDLGWAPDMDPNMGRGLDRYRAQIAADFRADQIIKFNKVHLSWTEAAILVLDTEGAS